MCIEHHELIRVLIAQSDAVEKRLAELEAKHNAMIANTVAIKRFSQALVAETGLLLSHHAGITPNGLKPAGA